jgi:hypothetical protein
MVHLAEQIKSRIDANCRERPLELPRTLPGLGKTMHRPLYQTQLKPPRLPQDTAAFNSFLLLRNMPCIHLSKRAA